jgi:hypothetical protein
VTLTVAVNVTASLYTDGLPEEITAVLVEAWFTTWLIVPLPASNPVAPP